LYTTLRQTRGGCTYQTLIRNSRVRSFSH